jgi:hypothetical protein
MYVCMQVCMYVCIYVYVCTYETDVTVQIHRHNGYENSNLSNRHNGY